MWEEFASFSFFTFFISSICWISIPKSNNTAYTTRHNTIQHTHSRYQPHTKKDNTDTHTHREKEKRKRHEKRDWLKWACAYNSKKSLFRVDCWIKYACCVQSVAALLCSALTVLLWIRNPFDFVRTSCYLCAISCVFFSLLIIHFLWCSLICCKFGLAF